MAGAIAFVAAFAPAQAEAQSAESALPTLQPTSPWRVDYGDSECRLIQRFGTGADEVTLRFARATGIDRYDMVIAGPGVPNLPDNVEVTITLEPQAQITESLGYSLPMPDGTGHFLRWFDVLTEFFVQMTATQDLTVHARNLTVRLHLINVTQALAALQVCHDDLLHEWGIDIAAYRALQSPPRSRGSEVYWVTTDDYPNTTAQGTVTTMLSVRANGEVRNCRVLVSSRSLELDQAACATLQQRARFHPAIASDGTPVESWFIRRIVWRRPPN